MHQLSQLGGSAELNAAAPAVKREIASAILAEVFRLVPIHIADQVTAAVRSGKYGDSDFRASLEESGDAAEAESADAIDQLERSGDNDIEKRAHAHHRVALAFYASYHALDSDPATAVYETAVAGAHAIGWPQIVRIVNGALGQHRA